MIRRQLSEENRDRWLLIPQMEHARLAGELAQHWQLPPLDDSVRSDLLWVIVHHDDGWQIWDDNPGLDDQGRPHSFLDMPQETSWEIWTRSIEIARSRSSLAAYLVARHFLGMTQGSPENEPFNRQQTGPCEVSLQSWLATEVGHRAGPAQADAACDLLRTFDWLSLLFCCTDRERVWPIETGDLIVNFDDRNEKMPTFDPWPFGSSSCTFSVEAWEVPVAAYETVKQLKQAAAGHRLTWDLREVNGGAAAGKSPRD